MSAGADTGTPAGVRESRIKAYRKAHHRAHYGTVSACLPRPEKEAFRAACRREGKTQHEVISMLVAEWMEGKAAFGYDLEAPEFAEP